MVRLCSENRGFTLVEAIISITVAAILGTILIQVTGRTLSNTAESIQTVGKTFLLRSTMEKITCDYRSWLRDHPDELLSVFTANVTLAYDTASIDIDTADAGDGFAVAPGLDADIDAVMITVSTAAGEGSRQSLKAVFSKGK